MAIPKNKMAAKREKPHYVDNKKFYAEIVKFRALEEEAAAKGEQSPRLPNYIGECIYKIATKLSYKPCFMNYSFRDEMIDDGIENCIMYFKDFNIHKTQNPFAYFTQVIYYAFLRRIAKEERNRYTTYKYFQESMILPGIAEIGFDDTDMSETSNLIPKKMYDNINDFMARFEKKEAEKKKKRKELKGLQKFYEDETNVEGIPEPTISSGITDQQHVEQEGERVHSEQLQANVG